MIANTYLAMPTVIADSLISNVYAVRPAYMMLTSASALESVLRTIYYIVMFVLILAAAYYVTKFLAKKGMVQSKTKNMRLIESMPLGADKSLHLIKVGKQYFLIGSAFRSIFMISEIEQEKLFMDQREDAIDFDNIGYDSDNDSLSYKDFSTFLGSVKQNTKKLKSIVRGNKNDEP